MQISFVDWHWPQTWSYFDQSCFILLLINGKKWVKVQGISLFMNSSSQTHCKTLPMSLISFANRGHPYSCCGIDESQMRHGQITLGNAVILEILLLILTSISLSIFGNLQKYFPIQKENDLGFTIINKVKNQKFFKYVCKNKNELLVKLYCTKEWS